MSSPLPHSPDLVRQLLTGQHEIELSVQGYSMSPCLRPGDRLRITAWADAGFGDVVVVEHGDLLVLHRIVGRRRGHLLTRGDATEQLDPPCDNEQRIGVVVAAQRRGRQLHFGFGPERWILAALSRLGLLFPLLRLLRRLSGPASSARG